MILTLVAIALFQDGPVRTAPESPPQASAAPLAGPVCSVDGEPVATPGCPEPEPTPGAGRYNRLRDAVSEERRRRQNAGQAAPAFPPLRTAEDCAVEANRGPGEAEFDCALRFSYAQRDEESAGRPGFRARRADGNVPAWTLDDAEGWARSACGVGDDEACRRQARNRLAMARAEAAAEPPRITDGAASPQNCRTVMRRSETGFGGSLSRVCGDDGGAGAEAALDRLQESLRPEVEPCDRPAALESQEAWIARCRALPPR